MAECPILIDDEPRLWSTYLRRAHGQKITDRGYLLHAPAGAMATRKRVLKFMESKYGLIALILNIIETVLIWGSLGIVRELGLWGRAPLWLEKTSSAVYVGGAAGLIFVVVGFFRDRQPFYALVALVLALLNLGLCGLIFAV
jgi:hypothetical protein